MERKNKNRGYQRMRVWEDAITLYVETSCRFRPTAFEMKRVVGQLPTRYTGISRKATVGDQFENTFSTFILR